MLFHLSVLRARLHGIECQQSNEDCLNTVPPKADFSIMFPPLRGGDPVSISDFILCGGDWAYAYHQLNALNETGVGVCRIPNGALFNTKNQAFREHLLRLNVIDAVIVLPKNSATFSLAAPATSLIVFRKGRKKDDAIQMIEFSSPDQLGMKPYSGNRIHHLEKIFQFIMDHNCQMVPYSELDASNLLPQHYAAQTQKKLLKQSPTDQLPTKAPISPPTHNLTPLKSVAQVYRGINVAGLSRHAEGAYVLRLSDVQNNQICIDDISRYDLSTRENTGRYQIQTGDILISCKGKAIKLCVVPELAFPIVLSHDFLGIRVDRTSLDPWYLFYFLQSPDGQSIIQQIQMGSSIPMIRASDLESLPLHYIPLNMQKQYASDLQQSIANIETKLSELHAEKQRAYEHFYRNIRLEDMP